MARFNSPLDHVKIAAPCKVDWEQMIGTERVRFCGQCSLNVYNLSSMTKAQAESLVAQAEGRLCVRFYRRADGSILTDNCPVGLRAIRRRVAYLAKAISAAVLSFFAGIGVYRVSVPAEATVMGSITVNESGRTYPVMGDIGPTGQIGLPAQQSLMMGELIPLPNSAERKARRHKDKLRKVSTR
jgi:hypothetical protein